VFLTPIAILSAWREKRMNGKMTGVYRFLALQEDCIMKTISDAANYTLKSSTATSSGTFIVDEFDKENYFLRQG